MLPKRHWYPLLWGGVLEISDHMCDARISLVQDDPDDRYLFNVHLGLVRKGDSSVAPWPSMLVPRAASAKMKCWMPRALASPARFRQELVDVLEHPIEMNLVGRRPETSKMLP